MSGSRLELVTGVLADINRRFPTADLFADRLEALRWPTGATCPYCTSRRSTRSPNEGRHHCNYCNSSYSITTGTFLAGTRLDLRKWLAAVAIVLLQDHSEFTARRLAVTLSINRNTACRITRAIEMAWHTDPMLLASLNLLLTEERILCQKTA